MQNLHDNLERFADGTLDDAEAEAFRMHLAGCSRCQAELVNLVQLEAMGSVLAEKKPTPAPAARRPARPSLWQLGAGGALLAAAAVLVVVVIPKGEQNLWLEREAERRIEGRVTLAQLDRYRPAEHHLGTEDEPSGAVPLKELSKLEEQGELRKVALAFLVRGRPQEALPYLERLPRSLDVDNDRAATLIVLRRYDEALRLTEEILAQHPDHPQALWNQALALEGLQKPLLAAAAFEKVARLNETGWSQEAAMNAEKLRKDAASHQRP